jgi:transposase
MTINAELEANILRLYYVEKWRICTIANQLKVHHYVVKRVLNQAGVPKAKLLSKPSLLDSFLDFIKNILEKYPTLRASRLYQMVCERGYTGGSDHFRHLVALHRPKPSAEAYLRLRTLPGEQAQVDWGHFGNITIGNTKRPLMAFVMVLSYSRKIFLKFYVNCQLANFLRGHEEAFNAWGGVAKILLYDNLKSAVLERKGDAIRFNPTLLAFAGHYRFEPRPVAVARGNEKGRCERAIRYIRDHFFAAREWKDLDDLNTQAANWCNGPAANRLCPEDRTISVQTAFINEQPMLITLPDNPFPTEERIEVSVGKTPYIRFDCNDYSIPHNYVRCKLTVIANANKIFILDKTNIIAQHLRSYDKGQQIEDKAHIAELVEEKRAAHQHNGQNRLIKAVPISHQFLIQSAAKNYKLHLVVGSLLKLLDLYGAKELSIAMQEALARDVPHQHAVRHSLERRRDLQELNPPINLDLPNDQRVRNLVIRPHSLDTYDQLKLMQENNIGELNYDNNK